MEKKRKTKRRRPPTSGRPRFTTGEVVRAIVVLSKEQHEYLKAKGNVSAEVRRLIDQERAREQGERQGSPK